jgi:hypothetical protein
MRLVSKSANNGPKFGKRMSNDTSLKLFARLRESVRKYSNPVNSVKNSCRCAVTCAKNTISMLSGLAMLHLTYRYTTSSFSLRDRPQPSAAYGRFGSLLGFIFGSTLPKARSSAPGVSSAPTSLAMSLKRWSCCSGVGLVLGAGFMEGV